MRIERTTFLTILQGGLITLQIINTQIAIVTDNKVVAVVVGAIVGGLQYVVQHLGNQAVPANTQKELDNCLPKGSQGSQQQPLQ